MLNKGGLGGFIERNAPTYRRLTLEFLSTVKIIGGDDKSIKFQLMNRSHTVSYVALREIFGLATRANNATFGGLGDELSYTIFWSRIANVTLLSETEKSSKIVHPGLRFIHRVLAMCFYGQGEPTNINREEISDLWALSPDGVGRPDWVDYFARACVARSRATKGKIALGGMITLIALARGVELNEADRIRGNHFLDIPSLFKAQSLKVAPNEAYCLTHGPSHTPWLRLPRPEGMETPNGPTNVSLIIERDDLALILSPEELVEEEAPMDDDEEDEEQEGEENEAMDTGGAAESEVAKLYKYMVDRHKVEDKRHEDLCEALSSLSTRVRAIESHLRVPRRLPRGGGPSRSL